MKKTKFHPGMLIPLLALIAVVSFAGRSINPLPVRPANRADNGTDTLGDVLQKVAMRIKEAFISGDSSLYINTFTPDGCLLAPNAPTLCGRQGLSRFFANTRKLGIKDAVFTSVGLYGKTAEYVTEQGTFEVFDANDHSLATGKLINIWKKTDQGWRLFRQMLNFNAPIPPAQPSSPK
ncbi:MAG TPA: nuclear transport factor 2 family protein [Puia sp.]|nr:nuclear transport factor 2 family protein [Puia sp.]